MRVPLLVSLAVTALVLGGGVAAEAQMFPSKPVRFVVGFPPGGGGDVLGRIVARRMYEGSGQSVVVENKPGATGTVAAGFVANAAPDGYTLLVGASSTNAIAPNLYQNLPYSNESLIGVNLLGSIPHVISVTPGLKVNSVAELVAYDKANPGDLTFPSAGNGSTPHLAGEMFNALTGGKLRHIPYKGAGQSIPDLLAGRVMVSFDTTGTIMATLQSGGLRPLAIASAQRFSNIPQVPTTAEAGLQDFVMSTWIGVFAPPKTPPEIVRALHAEMNRVIKLPDVAKILKDQIGCDDVVMETPEAFQELVRQDNAKFARLLKTIDVKID